MKKSFALYFALLVVAFAGFSCSSDDNDNINTSPYAYISSFKLGNLDVPFHDVTADGEMVHMTKGQSALLPEGVTVRVSGGEWLYTEKGRSVC